MMIADELIFLPEIGSTNSYLMDRISENQVKEGTLVWTTRQTAGKGLDDNTWESEPGKNLTFSFVLFPDFLEADRQFILNKAIVLGLIDLVRHELQGNWKISVKWPNDVYIENRKVAGILIQNGIKGDHIEYSVIGIGLNVNQETFSPGIPNPVSLRLISGKNYDLEVLLRKAVRFLQSRYEVLIQGSHEQLDKEYLSNLYRYREVHEYIFKGERIIARITGISRYGHLILEIPGEKTIECDLKELKFVL